MQNMKKIDSLTLEEVKIVSEVLQKVAEEAIEAAELIQNTYSFDIGEVKLELWTDGHNAEFLTTAGVWQARYQHQECDVHCTPEEIYRYFKAEYLLKEHLADDEETIRLARICRYFRTFLLETRVKAARKKAANDEL